MLTSDRLSLRPSACSILGLAAASLPFADLGWAQTADSTPRELPPVSVEGSPTGNGSGYQVESPGCGKLTEPLIDTPLPITELPRKLLNDQGVTTMREALRNVPGISIAAGEGGQQGDNLSIRGFNAQNDFYLDDVRDFGSYFRDPFNLEAIEVLKGPPSVLFGRGSSGGAINQVSKQPQLVPITAGTLSFGTDGLARMTADVNRPIQGLDEAALRLNVMIDRNNAAGHDAVAHRRFGFAPALAFGFGTDTRLVLDYYHLQEYDTPDYGIPWINGCSASVPRNNLYGYPDSDYFRTNVNIGTVKIEHDFNEHVTIKDQLRYASYDRSLRVTEPLNLGYGPGQDISPGTPLSSILVSRHVIALSRQETILDNQTNATIRFSTGPVTRALVSGMEVARQISDPTRYTYPSTLTPLLIPSVSIPAFTLAPTISSIAGNTINNYAIYAVDTMRFGPHWDIVAGWRWDRYESTFHQIVAPKSFHSRNDDLPTYRGAVVYKPNTNRSIYLRVVPPLLNRYEVGESFGTHVDNAIRQAKTAPVRVHTDLSAMRTAAFFWVQSMLRGDEERTLLFDLDTAIQHLARDVPDHPAVVQLTGVYHNLLRLPAEV